MEMEIVGSVILCLFWGFALPMGDGVERGWRVVSIKGFDFCKLRRVEFSSFVMGALNECLLKR